MIATLLMTPVYQATATLLINFATTGSSYENTTASLEAVPTYAQLVLSPAVLKPVVAQHSSLTVQGLSSMLSVEPVASTQLIKLTVENNDPFLASELANEICQSFEHFAQTQLPVSIQILPADLPASPTRPKPLIDTLIGALIGAGFAVVTTAFLLRLDRLDRLEQLQGIVGWDILSILPNLQQETPPRSPLALIEKYRVLCTRLNHAQVVQRTQSILFTSARVGEGKSTVAANVARCLALMGKQVLLVDANLGRPTLHDYFRLPNHAGLSNVLSEMWVQRGVELYSQATDIPSLRVLTVGVLHPHTPMPLQSPLASQLFEHLKHAPLDYVLIDGPALSSGKDVQRLLSLVQGIVLVMDASLRSRYSLLRLKRMLGRTHPAIVGMVLNRSPWKEEKDTERQYVEKVPAVRGVKLHTSPSWQRQEVDTPPQVMRSTPQTTRATITTPIVRSRLFKRPGT